MTHDPMMTTVWRAIPSAQGYSASDDGQIRRDQTGLILKPNLCLKYASVFPYVNGKAMCRGVHALVCEAFHGPKPSPSHQTAHNDGNKDNNAAANLRWATASENNQDKKLHGTWQGGSKNPRAKLSETQVAEIKKSRAAGASAQEIADLYGVAALQIRRIVRGTAWKHVGGF